jgi:hypothetical protein
MKTDHEFENGGFSAPAFPDYKIGFAWQEREGNVFYDLAPIERLADVPYFDHGFKKR